MNERLRKWFSSPWYPLPLAAYPILTLLAINIQQMDASAIVRPLLISLGVCTLFFLLNRLLLKDWYRAAFLTAILTLLFFSYGHVYDYTRNLKPFGVTLGRHRLLLAIWIILAGAGVVGGIWRNIHRTQVATFNLCAVLLLVFPLYTINSHLISERLVHSLNQVPADDLQAMEGQHLPDVYYIILDSYTRSDVLLETYNYDNSFFVNELAEMGFHVADCSASNYMWTQLSISSTLNMQYLQDIPAYVAATDKNIVSEDLLKHSLVRSIFEAAGYQTVAFATGFPFNEITDADHYLEPPVAVESVREFEGLLLQTTLLRVLEDFDLIYINRTVTARYRDRTLFALAELENMAHSGGPKFVYVHLIPPHPPFVFGPQGQYRDPFEFVIDENAYTSSTYTQGYLDQVTFISNEITQVLRSLIDDSDVPPIIVLQGDHGPWKQVGENRVSIFNSYYLPGHENAVYPTISPVNTFRVILNEYFHGSHELLEDVSYNSPYDNIYDFTVQPVSCADRSQ